MSPTPDKRTRLALKRMPPTLPDQSVYRYVVAGAVLHVVRATVGPPFDPICGARHRLTVPRTALLTTRPPDGRRCPGCIQLLVQHVHNEETAHD